jgi:hypothetical protein
VKKTELRARPHSVFPDETVIELWWGGEFIGQVTGADGPGVRIISRHRMDVHEGGGDVVEVGIDHRPEQAAVERAAHLFDSFEPDVAVQKCEAAGLSHDAIRAGGRLERERAAARQVRHQLFGDPAYGSTIPPRREEE